MVVHRRSAANTLAAPRSIRAVTANREPVHVILENLAAHRRRKISHCGATHNVELCFTPTHAWANPGHSHFEPLRDLLFDNCDHPNLILTYGLTAYLR